MAFLVSSPEIATFACHRSVDSPAKPNVFSNPNLGFRNIKALPILKNDEKIGSIGRVKVTSTVNGCEVKVSDVSLYVQFSAQVKPEPKKNQEEEEKQNYYVNLGYAIRTLRDEFPELFYKELNFDIYRDDIIFKDPLNTFTGIENYKSIFWALRIHGKIFFKALWVDIISMWQPMENVIMVRFTVHGIIRAPWESRGRFDGTSLYKLDKKGKIYEHKVDNIALNSAPPKYGILSMQDLIQSIGCPTTPKPTYFETSSLTLLFGCDREAESSKSS